MSLPEKGWKGYGSPAHPMTPDWKAIARVEMDLEVAEYRLRHDGIKPELLAYLRGIGELVR